MTVIFGIIIFTAILPTAMMLQSFQSIMNMMDGGSNRTHVPRWAARLVPISWYLVGPSSVLIFIFGVVITGSTPHFQTAHGITGLILILIAVLATLLSYITKLRLPEVVAHTGTDQPPDVSSAP